MSIDFGPFESVYDYWLENMPIMACEEMAELIQAISKFERSLSKDDFESTADDYRQAIVTEMADVYIACAALSYRYRITPADIGEAIWKKMDKKY